MRRLRATGRKQKQHTKQQTWGAVTCRSGFETMRGDATSAAAMARRRVQGALPLLPLWKRTGPIQQIGKNERSENPQKGTMAAGGRTNVSE